MRDLILLAGLIGAVPMIMRAPIVGLLAWMWIALMNPQREVYTFLAGFGLNLYIAILTLVAWAASKERKMAPVNPVTMLLILFGLWTSITNHWALDPVHSGPLWTRALKCIALALAVATLANTRLRLQAVIWTLVVSLGYYAVKGGGFVLLSGGHHRVFGPEDSMIEDNNALGLVLVVVLPLLAYLHATSRARGTRLVCLGTMVLTFLAILGTYSRGALITLTVAAGAFALRSKYGFLLIALGLILAAALPSVLPSTWLDRMATIRTAEQDDSFEGRVAAWRTSVNIAMERPLGGGFSAVENDKVVLQYHSPGSSTRGRAAHSIYFQVLGDHGFTGLGLFLALLAAAWFNCSRVLATTRGLKDLRWANQLARMLQVSIVAIATGGAALSMAYYDGFLIVFALTAALLAVVRQPASSAAATTEVRWKQGAARSAAALPQ